MTNKIDFARRVIKGKIAEHIFEFMFRESDKYDVIRLGYEYNQPQLAQHIQLLENFHLMDNLRNTPDFLLLSTDKKKAYMVEVKYRTTLNQEEIKNYAEDLAKKWDPSFLFVATPEGFYSAACHDIINHGEISKLADWIVPPEVQNEYLHLLNEFEPHTNP